MSHSNGFHSQLSIQWFGSHLSQHSGFWNCIVWEKLDTSMPEVLVKITKIWSEEPDYSYFYIAGGTIYYSTNLISAIFLLKLATQFPKILKRWHEIEEKFLTEPYTNSGISLKKQIRILASIVYPLAFLEHLLSHISFIYDRYKQAQICGWYLGDVLAYYITTHLSHIFEVIPYNTVFAIWIEFVNSSITVVWNFIDIIIIVFSIGIAFQFRQINYRLQYFKGRVRKTLFSRWIFNPWSFFLI